MAEDLSQKQEKGSGRLRLGLIGCGLVVLFLLAIFVIVFVFGQYAGNPRI